MLVRDKNLFTSCTLVPCEWPPITLKAVIHHPAIARSARVSHEHYLCSCTSYINCFELIHLMWQSLHMHTHTYTHTERERDLPPTYPPPMCIYTPYVHVVFRCLITVASTIRPHVFLTVTLSTLALVYIYLVTRLIKQNSSLGQLEVSVCFKLLYMWRD